MVYLAGAINVADIMDGGLSYGPIFLRNYSALQAQPTRHRREESKGATLSSFHSHPRSNLKTAPFYFTRYRIFLPPRTRRSRVLDLSTRRRLNSRYASFYRPSSSFLAFIVSFAETRRGNTGRMTGEGLSERRAAVSIGRSWMVVTIRRIVYEIPFMRTVPFVETRNMKRGCICVYLSFV